MDKLNLENFDWGWMSSSPLGLYHQQQIINEIFGQNVYERFFEVCENDIVLDVGASHGPFTYSILHKKPKHVYCVEPSQVEFPILVKNTIGYPVTPINKGLSDNNELQQNDLIFGGGNIMEGITFQKLKELYNLKKIDFIKTDCEGGEYCIFNEENFEYVKENVRKISGEWHLDTPELKSKFRKFRELYLSNFENHEIFSVDAVNVKWDLWNEHFIEYYNQVIIYIENTNYTYL